MNHLLHHIIAFAATRTALNTMQRMVYPFLAVFGRGLGVDLPALSAALMARSLFGVFGPVLATIADSRGRKTGMLTGLALFSAGTALVVLRPVYPAFVLALILTMLGKYTFDVSMQAYVGDRVSYQRRGLVMAVTEFGWSLSFIVGVPLIGLLIARRGWLAPFPALTIVGLTALAGLAWLLPKDNRLSSDRPGIWKNFGTVLSHPPALAGLAVSTLASAANETINLIFGVWMEDSFGLQIAALGAASAVIGLSELGGESLVGLLTDRLGKTRAVAAGLALNSLTALALPLFGGSLFGALAGLFLFYITFEFTLVSSIPIMTEVAPGARATMMSLNVAGHSTGRALGALLASRLYAYGILANGLAAILLNLLALAALRLLVKGIGAAENPVESSTSG